MNRELLNLVDYTKVARNEAYIMYIEGKLTREQWFDYLHERTFYLLEKSSNNGNDKKKR